MSRAPRFFTQEQISKRIKSGRGQGMGKDYQPWLTIQDVPSRGVSLMWGRLLDQQNSLEPKELKLLAKLEKKIGL